MDLSHHLGFYPNQSDLKEDFLTWKVDVFVVHLALNMPLEVTW